MGANAQTTVQKFLSGAVLTAEQQNISAATGVPVFATTVTRDAAFGGANKVLAEGQTCYLESTNVVQYYDGAAWATVGPTAAPTSGLVVVKAETVISAATTFFADSVFTSAYSNYLIRVAFQQTSSADVNFQFRAGGVTAATNYNSARLQWFSGSATGTAQTGQTSAPVGTSAAGLKASFELAIFQPVDASPTVFTSLVNCPDAYTTPIGRLHANNHSTAASYDGFIITGAGTMTGTYTVYGYGKTL